MVQLGPKDLSRELKNVETCNTGSIRGIVFFLKPASFYLFIFLLSHYT